MIGADTILAIVILLVIGILILKVVDAFLFFLPAIVMAGVVWYLTGIELYAALVFLAVCVLSLTKKK